MLHRNNYVTFKKGIDFFSFCYKSFILLIQHFQVILQLLFLLPHRKAFTPATLCYIGVEFFFYYNSIFAMFFYYDTRTVQNKHFFLIFQVQCFISFISFICRTSSLQYQLYPSYTSTLCFKNYYMYFLYGKKLCDSSFICICLYFKVAFFILYLLQHIFK